MNRNREQEDGNQNGFEDWGGYMAAKRAKLDVQFNRSADNGCESNLFAGVSISINGYVNPTNLRSIFVQHGGSYHSFATTSTDFVIASNLSDATKAKWGKKTLRPEWITQSIAVGKKLDHREFFLYNYNEENKQTTIIDAFKGPTEAAGQNKQQQPHGFSSPTKTGGENVPSNDGSPSKGRRLMAWEDGFLEEFWAHSRLHYISTMKRTLQLHVGKLRRSKAIHDLVELKRYQAEVQEDNNNCSGGLHSLDTVLFLVDLDCFFVAVGRLTRPHMENRPVVVTHYGGSKGITSNSDIACASYEARRYGIRNGMWVSEAKELCPGLEVIPYDFEAYQRVSMMFCNVVAGLTLDVEPGSCDEILVDVTSVLRSIPGSSPLSLAEFLRRRIFQETGCKASVGIGKNRLLAKLASKKAKPDGVFMIDDTNLASCLENQPLRDLTGVGYSLMEKIAERFPAIKTCGNMQEIRLEELKNLFGVKKGETLYNACRGIDEQILNFDFERPKSISLDVNYGIRMTERWQFEKLLMNLCKAISRRAQEAEACGTKVHLTILTQQKGAPEPQKQGGHGWCDVHNKSATLMNPTRNNLVIFKSAQSMLSNFTVPVEKYRGISLSLTGLKFDFDGKKEVQTTILNSIKNISIGNKQRQQPGGPPEPDRLSNRGNQGTVTVAPNASNNCAFRSSEEKLDIDVISALPKDIQKEVLEFYGYKSIQDISPNIVDEPIPSTSRAALNSNGMSSTVGAPVVPESSVSERPKRMTKIGFMSVNESFMEELPEDIRNEFRADLEMIMEATESCNKATKALHSRKAEPAPAKAPRVTVQSVPPKAQDSSSIPAVCQDVLQSTSEEEGYRVVSVQPGENPNSVPFNRINWWRFDDKDKLPTESKPEGFLRVYSPHVSQLISTPGLNHNTGVAELRKIIREGMKTLPNPRRSDLTGLITYFEELVAGHYIKQTQLLLKFLSRLSEDPNVNAKWSKICKVIICICQNKIQRLFGVPLQLHNIEDDEDD